LTLLDANALIALLLGEPAEREVTELLRGDCAIPAPCLAEVVDQLVRKHGVPERIVPEHLGPLIGESMQVVAVDANIAWLAGEIHAAHYDRKSLALSLADCLLLASAGPEDEIATTDGAVAATARNLGIGLIPLPDSDGRRPEVH
jgi:predicted nucleic acid-binding protein